MTVDLSIPWERKCPRCKDFTLLEARETELGPVIECPHCDYYVDDEIEVERMLACWKRCMNGE